MTDTLNKPLDRDDLDREVRKVIGRGIYSIHVLVPRLQRHLRMTFGHVIEKYRIETYDDLLRLPGKFIPAMICCLASETFQQARVDTDRAISIAAPVRDIAREAS
ncbi:MAG TPA: hypothetical protein VMU11_03040 [Verrucomicrobiae bacterium]|nr:hypothetical protein [Verrucomicrobiae bacterium]